jgi:hypothetical protein
MTECNHESIQFSSLNRKKIQADFNGGTITSDAGALLLREVDKQIGLVNAINNCIPDPRHPVFTLHSQQSMLAQRIFAIAQGYEDLNDHQSLRDDPLFQVATERAVDPEMPLASTSTLWRLEDRVTRESMIQIVEAFVEIFIKSQDRIPEQLILDFDATDDPLHGQQEGRFFHGYYDCYCYLPLYVFCGEQLLVPYLRPSNIDGAKHSWAILKLLVERFRQVWPEVRIIFRGDSGFCRWKMMRWCENHGVYYVLGLSRNPVLERKAYDLLFKAKRQYEETGEAQRLLGVVYYAAETWDRERRVIARVQHDHHGPNPRFVVSNLPGSPSELYDELYCQRGDMENRIKEQQLWLFADRTSSHDFLSNQFRLILSSAAYILIERLRNVGLKGTSLSRAQTCTIRQKLLKVAARVKVSSRRVVFHLSTSYPYKSLFWQVFRQLLGKSSTAFGFD